MEFAVARRDRQVIDAGETTAVEAVLVELPILIAAAEFRGSNTGISLAASVA
jgi:hypothetical protein